MNLVIALMLSGVTIAMAGMVAAVLWRNDGVTARDLVWAGSTAAAHPERYVRPERLTAVRRLNLTGVALFLIGALLAAGQALLQIR
jgi:hypothetical protein